MNPRLHRWGNAIWRLIGRVSLRIKVMGIALSMIVLLGLSITGLVRDLMTRALTWELQQRGLSIAHDLAGRSADLILTNNLYSLHELTHSVVPANEDVRYAFILDPRGQLLSDSFDDDFPSDLLAANILSPAEQHHVEMLQTEEGLIQDIAVPVFGGRAGVVRIGMSLRRLEATITYITHNILLATLLISILGIAISAALTWLLTRPVLDLAEATKQVAQNNLSHRLKPWANDEIGQLQSSFNAMMENLEQSRRGMQAAHVRLIHRNKELAALYEIALALSGPLGLSEALERALNHVIGMVPARGGWICIVNPDGACRVYVKGREGAGFFVRDNCCQYCKTYCTTVGSQKPIGVRPLPAPCPLPNAPMGGADWPPAGHAIVPLPANERAVGILNLVCSEENCFDPETMQLLATVGRQLGLALENARLWEELRHKEAMRGQLLRKIITAQEEERRRIARELHDETGQAITSLLVSLKVIEGAASLEQARALASEIRDLIGKTLDEVRDLASELRPSVLDDLGLVPALARYVGKLPARFGFQVDFIATGTHEQRLPREIESTLYRIAQEALTNVARHAKASHVSLLLEQRRDAILMLVEDNGVGFDAANVMSSAQEREPLGLYGMRERASLVGGCLTVESKPGAGTTISVQIPLEGEWLQQREKMAPRQLRPSES